MSSSQLTLTPCFFRGVGSRYATNQMMISWQTFSGEVTVNDWNWLWGNSPKLVNWGLVNQYQPDGARQLIKLIAWADCWLGV